MADIALDFVTGRTQQMRLVGDVNITSLSAPRRDHYVVVLEQDAIGGRSVTWPASVQGTPAHYLFPNAKWTVGLTWTGLQWIVNPIDNYVLESIGYGGMFTNSDVPGTSLGGGWDILDYYDTIDPAGPVNCSFDTANGQFAFESSAVWEVILQLVVSHNESNQGRQTNVRLWNVTDSVDEGQLPVFIGRNQPGSMLTTAYRQVVQDADVGKLYRMEAGSGDSVTSIVYNLLAVDLQIIAPLID